MTRSDFLLLIKKECDFAELSEVEILDENDDWDSLNFIKIISLFKSVLNFMPDVQRMRACATMAEILDLGEGHYD